VVHERDAPPVHRGDDLVPQDAPGVRGGQLLDVRAAEAAREHADAVDRLRHVRRPWRPALVDDDRAHRPAR
jgi:hypothetical protein